MKLDSEPRANEIIGQRYLLKAPLRRGGMAAVWSAEHLTLRRPVAVKFLNAGPRDQSGRFLREARIAAAVTHRNVVDILDFGATAGGRPYMVMELLEGRPLGDVLAAGAVPLPAVIRIVSEILAGLSAVHAASILHGDLKPDNVFLVQDADGHEYPKLVDFGISRVSSDESRLSSVVPTHENLIVGTPEYMSPEQARGEEDMDARADVYSLGVLMYEMLTGAPPYQGRTSADTLALLLQAPLPSLAKQRPDLPPGLVSLVERCLARDPSVRPGSARGMRLELIAATMEASASLASDPEKMPLARELARAVGEVYEPGDSGLIPLLPQSVAAAMNWAQRARSTGDAAAATDAPPRAPLETLVAGAPAPGPDPRLEAQAADTSPRAADASANAARALGPRRWVAPALVILALALAVAGAALVSRTPTEMTVEALPDSPASPPQGQASEATALAPSQTASTAAAASADAPASQGAAPSASLEPSEAPRTRRGGSGSEAQSAPSATPAAPARRRPPARRGGSDAERLVRDPGF